MVDPKSASRFSKLAQEDPELTWSGFCARLELIFRELQAAWSDQDLKPVRGFLSDNLYESWQYWVRAGEFDWVPSRIDQDERL